MMQPIGRAVLTPDPGKRGENDRLSALEGRDLMTPLGRRLDTSICSEHKMEGTAASGNLTSLLYCTTPRCGSGGKSSRPAVGGLPVRSPPWACRSVPERDA